MYVRIDREIEARWCSMLIRVTKCVQRLQSDSKTVSLLEGEIGIVLDFGGIRTSEASTGLRRARKGALLDGSHALGVAGLIDGSLNLQRTMRNARHAVQGTQLHTQITPLVSRYRTCSKYSIA